MTDADDVKTYRKELFALIVELAKGIDGSAVVNILLKASETIAETGIDQIYDPIPHPREGALYSAFDITWLTILADRLNELRKNDGR